MEGDQLIVMETRESDLRWQRTEIILISTGTCPYMYICTFEFKTSKLQYGFHNSTMSKLSHQPISGIHGSYSTYTNSNHLQIIQLSLLMHSQL